MAQFGFIGMGNMGYAMLNGVLGEFAPGQIIFTTPHKEKCEKISAKTGHLPLFCKCPALFVL